MKSSFPRPAAGFSLVEVALALGIAAFCLVSIIGLLPIGVNSNRASFEQTSAANVASAVVSDLRATALINPPPATDQQSPRYQISIPGNPSGASPFTTFFVRQDGSLSGTMANNADSSQNPHYRVTLYFTSTGTVNNTATGNPNATGVRVLITWPGLADPSAAAAPSKFSGSFETVTGLVRN